MSKIGQIVTEYRKLIAQDEPTGWQRGGKMSLRDFAARLSEQTQPMSISQQAIAFWENGTRAPSLEFMLTLSLLAKESWVREFAGDVLAALRPDLYRPVGEIGKRLLAEA